MLVRVDVTRRSWMRALVSPVCWVRRWPMWSTPSVALTAPPGGTHSLHGSVGDCDGGYHVDVTVDLRCCGRLDVDAAVSVQHAAAAVCSAFSSDDSDCSESRTSMRHSNTRWNNGLPRAAGSRWIAGRWKRQRVVSEGHMLVASSARERTRAASPSPTSPESSS